MMFEMHRHGLNQRMKHSPARRSRQGDCDGLKLPSSSLDCDDDMPETNKNHNNNNDKRRGKKKASHSPFSHIRRALYQSSGGTAALFWLLMMVIVGTFFYLADSPVATQENTIHMDLVYTKGGNSHHHNKDNKDKGHHHQKHGTPTTTTTKNSSNKAPQKTVDTGTKKLSDSSSSDSSGKTTTKTTIKTTFADNNNNVPPKMIIMGNTLREPSASHHDGGKTKTTVVVHHYQEGSLYQNLPRLTTPRGEKDFGGLTFSTSSDRDDFTSPIPISRRADKEYEQYRSTLLDAIDTKVSAKYVLLSDKESEATDCKAPGWTGYAFPNCNQVHELVTERPYDGGHNQDFEVFYLNSGSYRDAWRLKRSEEDHVVLKRMIMDKDQDERTMHKIHQEAMIMERLSHSPRVLDIYSFCGTSVHVEAMKGDLWKKIIPGDGEASQKKLSKLDNEHLSQNDLTPSEILQISLDMAESLADLHGFEDGVITHADTHIEQWLLAPDGSIKLNDFNNAKEPLWDAKKGAYCTTRGGYGGSWRAPEEFIPSTQDESRDVYAYGNNIYTMLTGLWPFYDKMKSGIRSSEIQKNIIAGERPYVDPRFRNDRTYMESKLVEIMERCWEQERKDRPTIYEVVDFLKEVKRNATKKGELKPSDMIKIPI